MPPNDPRFLTTNLYQMEDEFRTAMSYNRMARGESDEVEYESGESESDLMAQLDQLGDGPPPGAPPPNTEWEEVSPEELLKELDDL